MKENFREPCGVSFQNLSLFFLNKTSFFSWLSSATTTQNHTKHQAVFSSSIDSAHVFFCFIIFSNLMNTSVQTRAFSFCESVHPELTQVHFRADF